MEIASNNDYHIYSDNGDVKLKRDTAWFTQIQTQLGVCQLNYCDFVFFTLRDTAIDRIHFDKSEFDKILQKSHFFFKKFLLRVITLNLCFIGDIQCSILFIFLINISRCNQL